MQKNNQEFHQTTPQPQNPPHPQDLDNTNQQTEPDSCKSRKKVLILLGVICIMMLIVSSYYASVFNDSRLLEPMELSEYQFTPRDLPMLLSTALTIIYLVILFISVADAIIGENKAIRQENTARTVSPKRGYLGFLGFIGLFGFWRSDIFIAFVLLGFFGCFYETKISGAIMDSHFYEIQRTAQLAAFKVTLAFTCFTLIIITRIPLLHMHIKALIIVVIAVSLALVIFLDEYFLYRYITEEQQPNGIRGK